MNLDIGETISGSVPSVTTSIRCTWCTSHSSRRGGRLQPTTQREKTHQFCLRLHAKRGIQACTRWALTFDAECKRSRARSCRDELQRLVTSGLTEIELERGEINWSRQSRKSSNGPQRAHAMGFWELYRKLHLRRTPLSSISKLDLALSSKRLNGGGLPGTQLGDRSVW